MSGGGRAKRLVVAALVAGLAGCHQASPQEKAQQMIHDCASEAGEYLDPHWGPPQVTGVYHEPYSVDVVLTAQGERVTASCGVDSGYYMHVLGIVETIQGVEPADGQLYLPTQHRWLTDAELHARMAAMLAPQPGEYAGVAWAPNPPAVYTVSDLARVASTSCFTLQSKLGPARQLVACQVAAGHRYWVSQGPLTFEVAVPPAGLPAIPPAPQPDWSTQPGGKPF